MRNLIGTKLMVAVFAFGLGGLFLFKATYKPTTFTEEQVQERVSAALGDQAIIISQKVDVLMEAMAYNDLISTEMGLWELSTFLHEDEKYGIH